MLFRWWKNRRRRQILSQPFPAAWRERLDQLPLYRSLEAAQQERLRSLVQVFVAEKNWEGLEGVIVTEEMQVTIAALACLLLLERTDELDFDHVLSVLIYPDYFLARSGMPNEAGIVSEYREARSGEAWYRGPVILSWEDSWEDAHRIGRPGNVVLHEFAHQLDMVNGQLVDGTPPMRNQTEYDRWVRVMEREFETLRNRCRHRQPGVMDCYGCKNPAEFFAVATETYFELPFDLQEQHPDLFDVLREFYVLDPTTWEEHWE
ncbi:MAG: zinc-dependent peptidase [Planctomycetaceae bacterium]